MAGKVRSRTMTNCWQVAVFPLLSTAVQVTTFVPVTKTLGASLVTVMTLQLSAAIGAPKLTFVALQPEFAETKMFVGQEMVGAVESRTMTSCWQLAVLPLESTTVQVTILVPTE